jgi:ABC-2 type transport system permease protein
MLVVGAQLGVIAGTYARSLDDVYSLETLVVFPLCFLAGVFYSVQSLPAGWQALSYANPVFYCVDAVRAGLLGHGDMPAGASLAVVFAIAAALTMWSLVVFRSAKRLKP